MLRSIVLKARRAQRVMAGCPDRVTAKVPKEWRKLMWPWSRDETRLLQRLKSRGHNTSMYWVVSEVEGASLRSEEAQR